MLRCFIFLDLQRHYPIGSKKNNQKYFTKMIKENSNPVLYGELAKSKPVDLNGLRGINTQFNGYSIAEGETVIFPTAEEIEKFGKDLFRKGHSRPGSTRETALVRVERINSNGVHRQDYFNLGVLVNTANEADGTIKNIDEVRAECRQIGGDAKDLMEHMIGKAIVGTDTVEMFGPKYDRQANTVVRDENGRVEYAPRKYVTIDYVEVPAK